MSLQLYNTLTRKNERLETCEPNHVRMYTCGPTVYDYAHIGNFRAYMFEDLLRRTLKFSGYKVTHVMNLTDVDDKTIRASIEKNLSLKEYTTTYSQAFFEDLHILNIEKAEFYPAATGHIEEMIELISRLIEKGYAYPSDDGSVYFHLSTFKEYGKLSRIDLSGMQPGARVAQDEYEKQHVGDFALWKAWHEEDGDVGWDSPWGKGRPGWHIECSAMSMKYLGESFDIHTGGIDNMFPHHEDEIAQSEAATGKPFVRYWMHCSHLVVDGKKMSKSLGNFYTLQDLLDRGYTSRELRYVLMGTHYRQTLNFTFEGLEAARAALQRIDEFASRLKDLVHGESASSLPDWAQHVRSEFSLALNNDLNISKARAVLFDMLHAGHKALDEGSVHASEAAAVLDTIGDLDRVFGFLEASPDEADSDAIAILKAREEARKNKDWAEADRLRDQITRLGWTLQDTPKGPKLKRK